MQLALAGMVVIEVYRGLANERCVGGGGGGGRLGEEENFEELASKGRLERYRLQFSRLHAEYVAMVRSR